MKLVRLEPVAPRSRVKHSTTEPLRSLYPLNVIKRKKKTFFIFLFKNATLIRSQLIMTSKNTSPLIILFATDIAKIAILVNLFL